MEEKPTKIGEKQAGKEIRWEMKWKVQELIYEMGNNSEKKKEVTRESKHIIRLQKNEDGEGEQGQDWTEWGRREEVDERAG